MTNWVEGALRNDAGNGRPVDELWAWVKTYGPDDEGVATVVLPETGPLPAVFARRHLADMVGGMMLTAQRQQGVPHRLVRFVRADEDPVT